MDKIELGIPWDEFAEGYYRSFTLNQGRPAKDARLVIGAVIIKHKLCLSDEETVEQIRENPYLQYFVGLPSYQNKQPFAPSLFVEIRKRMGATVFDSFQQSIVDSLATGPSNLRTHAKDKHQDKDDEGGGTVEAVTPMTIDNAASPQSKLTLDATVAEQAIRYPTDIDLLNEAREISEQLIDKLYLLSGLNKKPRSYRQKARKAYLSLVKQRRPKRRVRRQGVKQQLQYLRRNLKHINSLWDLYPDDNSPLHYPLLRTYWIIQQLYAQQEEMYRHTTQRCDDRIVSIHQPPVRPMVRGKLARSVEFGAKLGVSLTSDGIACVDHIRWDAYHEGQDLKTQVEHYKTRHGQYPEVVIADTIYGTREDQYMKDKAIRFAGKPLGRPKKITAENRAELKALKQQRRLDYVQRIPIEGKFGQGKNGYRLGYIRAKTKATSEAWVNSIFLVMNLMVLLKLFFGLLKMWLRYGHIILKWCVQNIVRMMNPSALQKLVVTF